LYRKDLNILRATILEFFVQESLSIEEDISGKAKGINDHRGMG